MRLHEEIGTPVELNEEIINDIMDTICTRCLSGGSVTIYKFGKFKFSRNKTGIGISVLLSDYLKSLYNKTSHYSRYRLSFTKAEKERVRNSLGVEHD